MLASCLLQMFYHKTFWWWNYSLHIIQIAQRHPIRMRFVPVRHTPIWIILIALIIMNMYFVVYKTYKRHKCTNSIMIEKYMMIIIEIIEFIRYSLILSNKDLSLKNKTLPELDGIYNSMNWTKFKNQFYNRYRIEIR